MSQIRGASWALLPLAAAMLLAAACSESIDDPTCARNADCASGRVCDAEGAYVEAGPLVIENAALPRALVGQTDYSAALTASGGLAPYSWSMEVTVGGDRLGWLEIDPTTGELRNRPGQVPQQMVSDGRIEVTVRDRSEAGAGQSTSSLFDMLVDECDADVTCYREQEGACWHGVQACSDGRLAEECTLVGPSAELEHCGPGCAACGPGANRCGEGRCRCGQEPECAQQPQPLSCCANACVDVDTALEHCGGCGVNCNAQVVHAEGVFCAAGGCDYGQCETGYLDCNGERSDGCELASDLYHCGGCDDDCTDTAVYLHTSEPSCAQGQCQYSCNAGYDDCDGEPGNGCEQPLSAVEHCGGCNNDCTQTAAGPICRQVAEDEYACGCEALQDCPIDSLCCNNQCVVRNAENQCAECGVACSILEGGLYCVQAQERVWECRCVEDADCRGDYAFSQEDCGVDNQCGCSPGEECDGSLLSICCLNADFSRECYDLLNGGRYCGICGADCAPGETCTDGVCSCTDAEDCPASSNAPDCQLGGTCGCGYYGGEPCPPGHLCCGAKGCCPGTCSLDPEHCSNECLNNNHVWCWNGCCPGCASEADCPPLPQ